MLGLVPLAGLLFLSGEFGAFAGVSAEGRVGQAPFQRTQVPPTNLPPGQEFHLDTDPHWTVVGVLAPIGELQNQNRARQVLLDYSPRLLWRRPNAFGASKTLVLHTATLSVTLDATSNLRFIERATASYGEADYQSLTQIIPNTPLPPVLKIFAVSAGTGLRWDADRVWRYETMFDVERRKTLGNTTMAEMESPFASFRQTNVRLDASGIARVSRRDSVLLTLGLSDRTLDHGIEVLAVTPQVGWRTRLARSAELRLSGGFSYAEDRGKTPVVVPGGAATGATAPGSLVRPVGSVELNGLLLTRRGVSWRGMTSAALDYYVDPFLRVAGPRGIGVVRTQVLLEPDWTIGLEGTFATSLRKSPIVGPAANSDETLVDVALPVRHRVSQSLIVETGLRCSALAPRIRADKVTFHQRQTWFYVSLTATTRPVERWQAPPEVSTDVRDEGVFARVETSDARQEPVETTQPTGTVNPLPPSGTPP
jgi:hypothetical protein